jgi:hypothetical protein
LETITHEFVLDGVLFDCCDAAVSSNTDRLSGICINSATIGRNFVCVVDLSMFRHLCADLFGYGIQEDNEIEKNRGLAGENV